MEAALSREGTLKNRYYVQARVDSHVRGQLQGRVVIRLWAWVQIPVLPHTSWGEQISWLLCASVSSTVRWDSNSAYLTELFLQFSELTIERAQNSALHALSKGHWGY